MVAEADVSSLYMVMLHNLGLAAVSHYLNHDSDLTAGRVSFVMELLEYAAMHNYFWFKN